jgi:hypothetical protein
MPAVCHTGDILGISAAVAQLPAQPAGSLVRYNVLVTYANNKTETLPNANDLAPVRCVPGSAAPAMPPLYTHSRAPFRPRSYYVYDSATAPTAGLNTIEMYGLTVPGGLTPPASRLFTLPQSVTGAVIRVGQGACPAPSQNSHWELRRAIDLVLVWALCVIRRAGPTPAHMPPF